MSSKVKNTAKNMEQPEQKTKVMHYRIDVEVPGDGTRTTYMQVTGVPEDLPEEYEGTVMRAAEAQFAAALNQRLFLEFYSEGKTSKEEQPKFYNLSRLDWIQIKEITKLD